MPDGNWILLVAVLFVSDVVKKKALGIDAGLCLIYLKLGRGLHSQEPGFP